MEEAGPATVEVKPAEVRVRTFGANLTAGRSAAPAGPRSDRRGVQDKRDYIWLVYSVFFFIEPVLRHRARYWVECGAIYAVFLGLYVGCMRSRTVRGSLWWTASFTVLGVLTYPINGGASSFFIYTAAIVPLCVASVRGVVWTLAAESAIVLAEGLIFHLNWISIGSTILFLVVIGTANTFVGQQKRADCKLRMANEELEQLAALAERERIARDLHDVLGHTLSVIVLKAELAGRLLREGAAQDPARAAREIADVETTARTALKEVREAIGGYRAQGLAAELEQARRTLDAAGVTLRCEPVPVVREALTMTQETVLSLAVREAVTNIVRHAEATVCRVSVATEDGFHALRVEDDGSHRVEREGNGLRGMRERVSALGGVFTLESGSGTRLTIRLPVEVGR
jgi:two-component system sensor histidine kinase DesK